MELTLISASIQVARKNWNDWRDVFEYSGQLYTNPLLTSPSRFAFFLKEYSVLRTIRGGMHDKFRQTLLGSEQFLRDDSGNALDRLDETLRTRFGTRGGNHIVSVLSKVAAFVRPERFVAWDQFARKGVNIVLGRTASAVFTSYAEYLAKFDEVWNGQMGQEIRNETGIAGQSTVESQPRFQRRVLDVYLMKRGDRKV